jgi:hypothetical protein
LMDQRISAGRRGRRTVDHRGRRDQESGTAT